MQANYYLNARGDAGGRGTEPSKADVANEKINRVLLTKFSAMPLWHCAALPWLLFFSVAHAASITLLQCSVVATKSSREHYQCLERGSLCLSPTR